MHPPNPQPAALHALSGLDIAVDDATLSLRFGSGLLAPEPLRRSAADLRAVLRNPDAADLSAPVYTVYRGVTSEEARSEIERRGLLYAALVLRAGTIGDERTRIRGHINSHPAAVTGVTYPEVYEVWQGRALLYLQCEAAPDVSDIVTFEIAPGGKAIVPPGWASLLVNIGDESLVAGSWRAQECHQQYEALEALGGMAHYVLAGDGPQGYRLEPNTRYRHVAAPRSLTVQDYPSFGLAQDEPMFTTFRRNPDIFRFMTRPQDYAGIWTTLYS